MKTYPSVKAILMAIIITASLVVYSFPTITKAYSLNSFSSKLNTNNLLLNKLSNKITEIKPSNSLFHKNVSSLELNLDVDELRQIKIARKKAEEEQKRQEEERLRQEEEKRKQEEEQRLNEASNSQNGISYEELVNKLNRSLNSTLSGKGEAFAKYATNLGIDPYLAVAIVLHETGCKWSCSSLLQQCNNVGGMKSGNSRCEGTSYAAFATLDAGIEAYMNNLYNNYISQGLTTPEAMGPKYAASTTWASRVRAYMNEIEAN